MFRASSALLAAAFWTTSCLAGQEWAAFIAPDIPQTRSLFAELQRRSHAELRRYGLELRFVSTDEGGNEAGRATVEAAVAAKPRLIFATSALAAAWARDATGSIPIVFASVADPVRANLVASLSRPGANLTGFTYDIPVEGKQLELLREIAPTARRIGVLDDGTWLGERITAAQVERYEKAIGARIQVFRADTVEAMAGHIGRSRKANVDAWLVPVTNAAAQGRAELVRVILAARVPAVFGRSFFVTAGGLASCQEVVDEPMKIWHGMMREILGGTSPGDIPVQRPKRFEMALNVATARKLGINLPLDMLKRADRVVVDE